MFLLRRKNVTVILFMLWRLTLSVSLYVTPKALWNNILPAYILMAAAVEVSCRAVILIEIASESMSDNCIFCFATRGCACATFSQKTFLQGASLMDAFGLDTHFSDFQSACGDYN
jgi:hypothetical protein